MKLLRLMVCMLGVVAFSQPAFAVLKIDVTQGNANPMPIAIVDFSSQGGDPQIAQNITRVIEGDLERSGLFRPINKSAFIENITSGNATPQFASWRQINASGLVTGMIEQQGNQLKVTFRLWDVYLEQQVAGSIFNSSTSGWRRIAHKIADAIYTRLTGESGYFDTRVVYVAESGVGKNRVRRLAIMDQDGANHKFLTDGSALVLSPRFSPTSQDIIYLSFRDKVPSVHLRNIETGADRVIGNFQGMSFAPRFSHDGSKVAMSVASNGNTEIYTMDLRSRSQRQLTNNPAIDTSPSFSPDGQRIVFNSDRAGAQQLYTMNADGSNQARISFGEGRYGTPVWSPRGDLIAFTKMLKGQFHIGVMRPDGSGERILTTSYMDEAPTWSPNGRVIMFTRQFQGGRGTQGAYKIFSVDLTGYNEREVVTPLEASDPAWSPLLP